MDISNVGVFVALVRLVLALAVVGAGLFAARPMDAAYVAPSMEYGASAFPLGHPDTTDRDLGLMQAAGMQWVKLPVLWRSIEGQCNDCFDWTDLDRVVAAAQAHNLKIIARLDHQPDWARAVPAVNGPPDNPEDFADFVSALVARYGSAKIPAIEIWNEPNLSREWGDAPIDRNQVSQYVYLLKLGYQSAKKVDPNVTVLSAGLSPTGTADGTAQPDDLYLTWLYDEGFAKYTDAIGLHGNSFGLPPEAEIMSDPSRPHPSFYFRRVEQLRDIMVQNGDAAKQVWLLEFGYTTDTVNPAYSWFAIDDATKADYIVRAMKYARANWSPWIAVMTVWTLADPEWTQANEQYWWAITNPDGSTRPAYDRIAQARASGELP
ncbi:MAG: cellulase family glycosylhydrolase [Chloroflexi bacterium]|nr:cellulase family glycosylhydrolase [Chloroflexota bacterium]